ncbi:hypothetical protein A8L34_26295 [Bacillus sp. FJAT-27264]|uniref:hypothetical protein n=1 Tax=Paenibacillus sp. (strain DSM 101736 / FJAT-27264) TaxID=1850362 RepID=UPI000807AF40|nr:hypothetical protein [Bacillus sp. FJAT-27264]OBZ07637.1 hypothetical protein A8L34_26295 [Bacillus sp. FJAT-27264]
MTQFHYIGSPVELPLGERGSVLSSKTRSEMLASPQYQAKREELKQQGMVPLEEIFDLSHLRDEDCLVYDTEEDAGGIYIEALGYWNEEIRKHFQSPYVYKISPNWGSFTAKPADQETRPDSENASLKCCRELFKLMQDFGVPGSVFELYSCWADEEGDPRNKKYDRVIDLSTFSLEQGFDLLEKEYIVLNLPT